jgi:signal transduction histidine kinase
MSPWYVPSLYPILALSASLAVLVLWRDKKHLPIAAYCASLTAWSSAILLAALPETRPLGDRAMMVGFFIPATFLHVAASELGWRSWVVRLVYGLGFTMFFTGLVVPDLYLSHGGTEPGWLFAPMFAATIGVGATPMGMLWRDHPRAGAEERRRYLLLAGTAMGLGGTLAVGALLSHTFYPIGLYLLSCSVGLMTYVAQAAELPSFGRFIERSQRYALLAALLSTVWMFLLLTVVQLGPATGSEAQSGWTWEAALLLFVLTLTAQPLLTEARIWLTGVVFPGQQDADGLTRALADSEARAEHSRRLAEIGTMAAAVAHEVRNPLGVISACATVLERQGADAGVLYEVREQVNRAARFSDELLEYGRPSPLRLRRISLADAAAMAVSDVTRALDLSPAPTVTIEGDAAIDADLSQVSRLVGLLVENALLAGSGTVRVRIGDAGPRTRVVVEDNGEGVPDELIGRLFAPFVSGRGRSGPRPGTGLGLAIGVGIAERHGGTLTYGGRSELGGACFVVELAPPAPQETS